MATTIHVEEDFPRGGQEVITPLERRKIITQATHDDLFGKVKILGITIFYKKYCMIDVKFNGER